MVQGEEGLERFYTRAVNRNFPTITSIPKDQARSDHVQVRRYCIQADAMPSPPARPITAYYAKTPTKAVVATVTDSTPTSTASVTSATNGAKTTSTETTTTSSPIQPVKKTGFLSDAARKARQDSAAEVQAEKKVKLSDGSAKPSQV